MRVNTNMLLLVILLWAGTLPVTSPKNYRMLNKFWGKLDCDQYILPIHSIWAPRTSCEENKRVKCQPGYVSKVQTTCKNGDWLLEQSCQAVECPRDEKIINSYDLTQSRKYKEEFTFNCTPGFTGNDGTGILTCDDYNMWTVKQACQAVECPRGVRLPNSQVSGYGKYKEEFTSACNPGFTRNGATGTLICTEYNSWKIKRACQGCLQGENITNSDDVTEASIIGGEFTFNCSAGYTGNGSTGILTCGEFGIWTEKQACEGCPEGVRIHNSKDVTPSSKIGAELIVNCLIGAIPTGTLMCGENGTWIVEKACGVILEKTFWRFSLLPQIEAENCSAACAENNTCGFAEPLGNDTCQFYQKPIIYSSNQGRIECRQECKDDPRCLTFNAGENDNGQKYCRLFNADYYTIAYTDGFSLVIRDRFGVDGPFIEEKSAYYFD